MWEDSNKASFGCPKEGLGRKEKRGDRVIYKQRPGRREEQDTRAGVREHFLPETCFLFGITKERRKCVQGLTVMTPGT